MRIGPCTSEPAPRTIQLLKLTYRSEDLPVVAFVYRVKAVGEKRPVVVYNRGSYIRQGAARSVVGSTGWPMQGSWWSLPLSPGVRAPRSR